MSQDLRQVRMDKLKRLTEAGHHPYPEKYDRTHMLREAKTQKEGEKVKVCGRIMLQRVMGKLTFSHLQDFTGRMQVVFQQDKIEKEDYKEATKLLDIGDFIGVEGEIFVTKHGEVSVLVSKWTFLGKALRPLPEKWHGIQNTEDCYRRRYLDLIMNEDTKKRFTFRSDLIKETRKFYWDHAFEEVETSTLMHKATGANAKPYATHNNALDIDVYLRISHELPHKILITGGYDRVFEIGKAFRNEGADPSHLPEHTHFEHYAAYWNYEDNMKFTENLFDHWFDNLFYLPENRKVEILDKDGKSQNVNFSTPFKRVSFIEIIKKDSGIDIMKMNDKKDLVSILKEKNIVIDGTKDMGLTTLIDYLYKKVSRPKLIQPTFVYDYPKFMQPLARVSDKDENIVDQFQLVVNGWEVVKAYSELTDPIDQAERFAEQAGAKALGDDEAMEGDDEYIECMEYGMPPISGWGMGLDRIVTLLTRQTNLRDCVLFPLMKPEGASNESKKAKETKIAVALINKGAKLESWQEMNTVAHLNAAFGARSGKSLFMQDSIGTKDNKSIKLNIQHAIMIKQVESTKEIVDLVELAKENELEISEFTREMIETTDDRKVIEQTKNKSIDEVEYLGLLVFGNKKMVEKLTKKFGLYS